MEKKPQWSKEKENEQKNFLVFAFGLIFFLLTLEDSGFCRRK